MRRDREDKRGGRRRKKKKKKKKGTYVVSKPVVLNGLSKSIVLNLTEATLEEGNGKVLVGFNGRGVGLNLQEEERKKRKKKKNGKKLRFKIRSEQLNLIQIQIFNDSIQIKIITF